jgi:WD40 repeat protein/Cu/Ag efflux protein CusF
MRARSVVAAAVLYAAACHAPEHAAVGEVVAIDPPRLHATIRHDDIPGVMSAMTMRFAVAAPAVLTGIEPGMRVRVTFRQEGGQPVITSLTRDEPPPSTGARVPAPGVHDHTPHHGGVVGMSGQIHLEAHAAPDGRIRLWVSDLWRYPIPPARAAGSVTLELSAGDVDLPLRATDDALAAAGAPLAARDVTAHFALTVDGAPVEMDFLLPVAGGAGVAGVPVRGCTPFGERPREPGRLPRCTLAFARTISALAATPDGSTLLVGAVDVAVSAWRLPAGDLVLGFDPPPPLRVPGAEGLRPHPDAPAAIAIAPDGHDAVIALEGRLLRHTIATGHLVRELDGARGVIRGLAWSPDGKQLLMSVFYDAAARLLRADDGVRIGALPVEREAAAVAFSPDGALAAVGSELGAIALFSPERPVRVLAAHDNAVRALVFARGRLLSASSDGTLLVWDPGQDTPRARVSTAGAYPRLALAPGGTRVASAGSGGGILVHDAGTGTVVERLAWHRAQVTALVWARSVLVSGDADGHVALWDVAD